MFYTNKSQRASHGRSSFNRYTRPSFGGNGRKGPKKDNIHPSRFVKAAIPVIEVIAYVPTNTFEDFDLHLTLKDNIAIREFINPSPIQDQAIPVGLSGKDIIGVAATGSGKTIAFAVPALNRLLNDPESKVLIMAPTRELAVQIEEECRMLAKRSGLNGAVLIGGTPMGPQLRDLSCKPRIVIGTPGRIKDHTERGSLDLSTFNMVVLDEVDRMLDMGFINDIRTILSKLATTRQSFFFSATLDTKIRDLIHTFMKDPVSISVKSGETSDNVEQDIVAYSSVSEKIEQLHQVLTTTEGVKALVFDDTQRSVERLSNELIARGFKADAIHGGKSQGQRQRALSRFKKNEIRILVATDVAARGIDVADITHVINYSTPQTYTDYVHRVGRAGRAGRKGHALTFVEAR